MYLRPSQQTVKANPYISSKTAFKRWSIYEIPDKTLAHTLTTLFPINSLCVLYIPEQKLSFNLKIAFIPIALRVKTVLFSCVLSLGKLPNP